MAQSGYTPIQLYYSTTATNVPLAADLANGELAINITDGKLYYKDNTGTVKLLASNSSSTPVTSISFGSTGLTPATTTTGAVTVAGTLVAGNGGTGQSTYATGDFLYATSSSALGKLTIGANGYILQSNGTSPTWVAASTIVGGAGGSNTQVQYNSSGALAGSSSFVFDGTNVGIGTSSPNFPLNIYSSSAQIAIQNSSTGSAAGDGSRIQLLSSDLAIVNREAASIQFYTSDTERMRLDSSGNLGLGVTPSAWGTSGITALEIKGGANIMSTTADLTIRANAFFNGTNNIYKSNGFASTYQQTSGQHQWFTAPSGTAGNAITFTQAMTLDASGNLGIGTSSPDTLLHVNASAGAAKIQSTSTTSTNYPKLTFYHNGNDLFTIGGGDGLRFLSSGTNERMTLNSSGYLGIGITSPTAMLHTTGSSSIAALKTPNILEISTVSATAATGTINYDVTTQSVLYYTTNASGNFTLNFRGSSGTSLNTIMSTGDTVTVTFLCTNGSTAYYNSAVTIDGSSVTPKWQGGTAPTSGNASAVDSYTYAITKTGSAAFTVLASVTKFA